MIEKNRKIATILSADVVGYSRLMQADEAATLAALKARRTLFDRLVAEYGGREFGSVGDSLMAQFPSAVNAVECAWQIQAQIRALNSDPEAGAAMELRIGLNLGDVIEEQDGTLFGDGVNVAARLQALAPSGGVLVSGSVQQQVRGKIALGFQYAGQRQVKNIAEPIESYVVTAGTQSSRSSLFADFRRRKIFRSAFGYLVAAWIIVQVSAFIFAATGAPHWAERAAATLLVVGFPPAMMLAWLFDITPTGIRPSKASVDGHASPVWLRSVFGTISVGLMFAAVWWFQSGYSEQEPTTTQATDENNGPPVIAIAPIRNLTGDPQNDQLSLALSNLLRDRVARSRHVVVVSNPRWETVTRNSSNLNEKLQKAALANIDFALTGEILSSPNGFILTNRVTNLTDGTDVVAQAYENLSDAEVLSAVYRMDIMAKQALRIPHQERVDRFMTDFAVSNLSAYYAYISGVDYILRLDYKNADASLRAALELAPDFHIARYRLAFLQWATGDARQAEATIKAIPNDAPLDRRERLYVDAGTAFFSRNHDEAESLYTTLLDEFPFELEARQYLAELYYHSYRDEAAIEVLQGLLRQEPENATGWSTLAYYLSRSGQLDEAAHAIDQYEEFAPKQEHVLALRGDIAVFREEYAIARDYYQQAIQIRPNFELAKIGLARAFYANGDLDDSRKAYKAIVENNTFELDERITAAIEYASILRGLSKFEESSKLLVELDSLFFQEKHRKAQGLELRAKNALNLNRPKEAIDLMRNALARVPPGNVPTGYLHSRGVIEIAERQFDRAAQTIDEIRKHALPKSNPDRTEDKAAMHLEALIAMTQGEQETAAEKMRAAVDLNGYRYGLYRVDLAEVLLALGQSGQALSIAKTAISDRDPGDLRIDLEHDRARAHRLAIRITEQSGQTEENLQLVAQYEKKWGRIDDSRTVVESGPIQ